MTCPKQMAQFESSRAQFEAAGIGVAYIAGQSRTGLMGAVGWVRKHNLEYPYLCDETREVTKAYGVFRPLALDGVRVARPATLLVDSQRVVRFLYVGKDSLDRVWPEQLLREAQQVESS